MADDIEDLESMLGIVPATDDDDDQDATGEQTEAESEDTPGVVSAPLLLEVTMTLARLLPIALSLVVFGFSLYAGASVLWASLRAAAVLIAVSVFGWVINVYLLQTFIEHFTVKANVSTQSWEA